MKKLRSNPKGGGIAAEGKGMRLRQRVWLPVGAMLMCLVFCGCATISPYSEIAYQQATSLKVDSLALMAKAYEPYAQHQAEVEALRLKIDKAYEYAKGLPNNTITTTQWEILKDPNGHLLGGFLERWRTSKTPLSAAYIADKQIQVGSAFDQIIGLESGKIKPSGLK
jgi:hypothetical protein